ncbi:MAG: diaminopimelate dehydrogenase [Oscillospiraceae bacterium]|nr:diaminopimelate dehydrogenase [Oscillospiraceae bacterium]
MNKIQIGIVGYGNVSAGVVKALSLTSDMELKAVFTRRDPKSVKLQQGDAPILPISLAEKMTDDIDVMILCGGSAKDLPEQGPFFSEKFNIVDSYDTHAKIPGYLKAVDKAATKTTAIISSGWDPGLFSLMRLYFGAVLPDGDTYTFWGKGVSQGHSDAIRRIPGVAHAVQYTVPVETAIEAVRNGEKPRLEARQKHLRQCYVALLPEADKKEVEKTIKEMPDYFADYNTTVTFVELSELFSKHGKMPHGGMVLRSGNTGENTHNMEFSLRLDSNPEMTGSIMIAYARAAYRMSKEGLFGAKTVFDIPPAYLSETPRDMLIKDLL